MKAFIITAFFIILIAFEVKAQEANDGVLIGEARVAMKYKDYELAVKTLNKVSPAGRQDALYSYYMAQAYEGLGDDSKTLKYYQDYAKQVSGDKTTNDKIDYLRYKVNKKSDELSSSQASNNRNEAKNKFKSGDIEGGIYLLEKNVEAKLATFEDYLDLSLANSYSKKDDNVMKWLKECSQSNGADHKKILSYYLFVKYFKQSYFKDYLLTSYGNDATLYLNDQLKKFNNISGRFEPNIASGPDNSFYKEMSDNQGYINIAFDDYLDYQVTGNYSYKYKYSEDLKYNDTYGSIRSDQKDKVKGSISGVENIMSRQAILQSYGYLYIPLEYYITSLVCKGNFSKDNNTKGFSFIKQTDGTIAIESYWGIFTKK